MFLCYQPLTWGTSYFQGDRFLPGSYTVSLFYGGVFYTHDPGRINRSHDTRLVELKKRYTQLYGKVFKFGEKVKLTSLQIAESYE